MTKSINGVLNVRLWFIFANVLRMESSFILNSYICVRPKWISYHISFNCLCNTFYSLNEDGYEYYSPFTQYTRSGYILITNVYERCINCSIAMHKFRHWRLIYEMVIVKAKRVKPQMTNTIKNMDYNWTPGPEPTNNQEHGVPRAVFIPHSNSLPFEERYITLEQPVKVSYKICFQ